jgi:hypothetical protein
MNEYNSAMTIVDGNEMGTRDIKNDEVLGARVRTWTARSRMAELISISKIFERVLLKKFPFPFLGKKKGGQVMKKCDQSWHYLNTMQREGLMQGDNTFLAFQQGPVGTVPTFYNPIHISAV